MIDLIIGRLIPTHRARDRAACPIAIVPPLHQTECVEGMLAGHRIVDRLLILVADRAHFAFLGGTKKTRGHLVQFFLFFYLSFIFCF